MGLIMDPWKSEKEKKSPAQAQHKARSKNSDPPQFEVKKAHTFASQTIHSHGGNGNLLQRLLRLLHPQPSVADFAAFDLIQAVLSANAEFFPNPLRLGFPRIMAFSSNDSKVGSNIEVD
ncbi:hypothetical protein ACFX2B_032706 [Malus domestica]